MNLLTEIEHPPQSLARGQRTESPDTPTSPFPPIPETTALAALATLGMDDSYLIVGDHLELLLTGLELSGERGNGEAWPPLELVTVFQFVEHFSDIEALRAIRTRIDWKYALRLPLDYAGLPAPELAPFRAGLMASERAQRPLTRLLRRIAALATPWADVIPESAAPVLAALRNLNRMPLVYGTLARAIESLAGNDPMWFRSALPIDWLHRYPAWRSVEPRCRDLDELESRIVAIGAAGYLLLERLAREDAPDALSRLPEVELLRRVWFWQFDKHDGEVTLRSE